MTLTRRSAGRLQTFGHCPRAPHDKSQGLCLWTSGASGLLCFVCLLWVASKCSSDAVMKTAPVRQRPSAQCCQGLAVSREKSVFTLRSLQLFSLSLQSRLAAVPRSAVELDVGKVLRSCPDGKIIPLTTCKAMTVVQSVGETNEYEKMEKFLLLLDLHV